jgi:hypothetical protein
MKYLKKYNEASKGANDYKFRRDILPSEIEDIFIICHQLILQNSKHSQ